MIELRDKYSDERKSQILDTAVGDVRMEDLIAEEMNAVTISHNGYIKRLPIHTYRAQHRGGRGVSGGQTREDDFIEHFFVASTHAYLLCFTNRGQMYWIKVYDLPQLSRTSPGRALANVLALKPDEKISSVIPVRRFDPNLFLLMATRRGLVKKTALEHYSRLRAGGLIGIHLEEGDDLIGVAQVTAGDEIILSTRQGMAIRFSEADARPMGRDTKGVKGINLMDGDEVVGMVVTDPEGFLLTVSEKGYGKRTPFGANLAEEPEDVEETPEEAPAEEAAGGEGGEAVAERSAMRYRKQRRGGKGLRDIRTSDRNGPVVAVQAVRAADELMIITQQGMVTRTRVDEVRIVGRNTQGVRLISLNEGDKVVTAAKIAREDGAENGAALAEAPPGIGDTAAPEAQDTTPPGE
jgi:DNA gyrase subunit A